MTEKDPGTLGLVAWWSVARQHSGKPRDFALPSDGASWLIWAIESALFRAGFDGRYR